MKSISPAFIGCCLAVWCLSSCGDSDLENGARNHGQLIGTQTCNCTQVSPEEAGACADELIALTENYHAFLESAKSEGADMKHLEQTYNTAFIKASQSCLETR
jgi:hypothetical protein